MAMVTERGKSRSAEVAGTVRLMTDQPVEVPPLSDLEKLRHRWAYQINRRPWIVPTALLGAAAVVLLLRKR